MKIKDKEKMVFNFTLKKWSPMCGVIDNKIGEFKYKTFFMAEREGFEPSKQFPVYTLSKRAPSATRPPLPQESEDVFKTFIKAD